MIVSKSAQNLKNVDQPKNQKKMHRQILLRVFYDWRAYGGHLKIVRTHLTSLVYPMSVDINEPFRSTKIKFTVE